MNPHSRNLVFILDLDQELSHTNPKIMTNNVKRKSRRIPSPRTTRFALLPSPARSRLLPQRVTAMETEKKRRGKEEEAGTKERERVAH